MARVLFRRVKEVVIFDEVRFNDPEEFFEDLVTGSRYGVIPVFWIDGVIFTYQMLPWTDLTIDHYIRYRRIYIVYVKYAPMESYIDKVSRSGTTIVLRRIDSPLLKSIANTLKKRLGGKD